jgi:hypothetical protein
MKLNQTLVFSFLVLIVIASLYRIMPDRPWGFAPQIAMAIFGGAIIKDRKLAFILPLLSMFISDVIYEYIYRFQGGTIPGFYEGQLTNYILFGLMTFFGFMITNLNVARIALAALAAPTAFFLLSNSFVWLNGGGYQRPKTFDGLILCLQDGLPFYRGSLLATLCFSAVLFGGYYLFTKSTRKQPLFVAAE